MGYTGVLEMWYDFTGTLKELVNDFNAIELLNWSKANGKAEILDTLLEIPDTNTLLEIPDIDTLPEIPEQNEKTIESDLNKQSDDSALGCNFDEYDDEVLNDGIDEVLVEL
ncbi:hypothetical protein KIW84_051936 [Lathyrus oleraceus]|uniref:Uncharacterized protein n=1 Tax=Pisum sativum TaxID=3888 RepID=A0A9D5AEE6_PEA|nr:hypothetical protein KIW84_051936 [Pisum sativum]